MDDKNFNLIQGKAIDNSDASVREAAQKLAPHFGDPDIALTVEKHRRSGAPVRNFIKRLFGREADLQNQIGGLQAQLEAERRATAKFMNEHAALRTKVEVTRHQREKVEHALGSYAQRVATMTDEIQRLIRKTVHSGYAIERTAELVSVERTHSIAQITLEAERKAEQQAIANLKAFEKAHADELKEVGR